MGHVLFGEVFSQHSSKHGTAYILSI